MSLNQEIILRFEMLVVPLHSFLIRDTQARQSIVFLKLVTNSIKVLILVLVLHEFFFIRFVLLLLISDYTIISELLLAHLQFTMMSVLGYLARRRKVLETFQ